MRAILLLSAWQIKNSARAALRNPAVWIPVFLVLLLSPTRIGGVFTGGNTLPPEMGQNLAHQGEALQAGVFLTLAVLALGYLDLGFSGGALKFTQADVALLFPAPLSRRLVLLFRLPSTVFQHLILLGMLAWMFRLFVWLPLQQQGHVHGGWSLFLAVLLCVGGFWNIASTLDLFSSSGRLTWVGRGFRLIAVVFIAGMAHFLWKHGLGGLVAIAGSGWMRALFFPCHVAAEALGASLKAMQLSGVSWVYLLGWYVLTLTLLLTRRVNFYEAAASGAERTERIRTALRSGNWAAAGTQGARAGRLAFSLPRFGRGGGALVWAHLTAAAKRPGINFLWPFLGGFAFQPLVALTANLGGNGVSVGSDGGGVLFGLSFWLINGYYLIYGVALLSVPFYQRALAREALIRPLPVPMWQIAGAEIAARSLLGSLFPWGQALGLAALHVPGTSGLILTSVFCLPLLIVCINAMGHRLALIYPNAADKMQVMAAGFVQFLAYGLLAALAAPFVIAPLLLHASAWATALSVTGGLLLIASLLFRATVHAAAVFESAEDPPPITFREWVRDFGKGMSSPPLKKAIKPLVTVVIILVIVALIGSRVNKAIHQPKPPPRTVQTRVGDMTVKVSETGTVQPVDKVNVESKAPGRLLSIPITEGQRVQKGQLIAIVDRSQLDPQIAGLRAQLNQAQARLQQTVSQYNLQIQQSHMAVDQAQANLHSAETHLAAVAAAARPQELAQQQQAVARAQIALDDAKRTQARRQTLLDKGYIAQADFDSSQVAVDTAASNLATAQQALALTQAGPRPQDITDARSQVQAQRVALATARANVGQIAVSRADIAQARASVQQIQNQLAQLLVQLADTRIVAPASGIVLKKYKETDEIVQSATTGFSDAQSLVATLGSRLEVQVGINEVDIPKVRVGAPVEIHVDALPNTTFTGRVTEVAPASTNAFSGTDASSSGGGSSSISKFNVKVALSVYDPRLRPGMTADVDIISARHKHVVLAPLEAIPGTGNTATVTTLLGKTQQKRTVTLGLRNDTDVEITHGLRPGMKLVVAPLNGAGRRKFDVGGPN